MSSLAVYDTMLFFQEAALPAHRRHGTFMAVDDGRVQLCLSRELFSEISDVLHRPELQKKSPHLTPDRVKLILGVILDKALMLDPVPSLFHWPSHPDDNHLFNLAIAAKAEFLVTWETRLLQMREDDSEESVQLRSFAPQLRIETPPEFLQALAAK